MRRHSTRLWSWLLGLALLPFSNGNAPAGEASHVAMRSAPGRASVTCDAAVQHPIQVRIVALDPIQRGATVRLRLTASSRIGLSESEARVASSGGATVLGRQRATLGRVGPGREASAEFTVAIPVQGKRFLVEFRVESEGPAGRIGRGASFNILPDGPTAPARIVTGAQGQPIAEYPARRMP